MKRWMLSLVAFGLVMQVMSAGAVAIEDSGVYRTASGEAAPADIAANVRIIPPPTGGDLQVKVLTDRSRYHVGDHLKIMFGVNRDAYVYIFVTDAAGVSHQILPNYYDTGNFMRAGRTYSVPDRSYDLEITPPVGTDTVSIVAVTEDYPFLADYRCYSRKDPFPTSAEGATALVRRIESFRTEPSALTVQPLRPAIREQMWANDSTTYYVMGTDNMRPTDYRVARYGGMDIDTVPNNARIYIDGQYYGRTPQVVDRLEIGYHALLLTKEGYQPYSCSVYVQGNQTKQLDIFMKETPIEPGYSRGSKPKGFEGIGFFRTDPQ